MIAFFPHKIINVKMITKIKTRNEYIFVYENKNNVCRKQKKAIYCK